MNRGGVFRAERDGSEELAAVRGSPTSPPAASAFYTLRDTAKGLSLLVELRNESLEAGGMHEQVESMFKRGPSR